MAKSLSLIPKILVKDVVLILSMPLRLVTELVKNTEVKENNYSPPERGVFYFLNKFLVWFL